VGWLRKLPKPEGEDCTTLASDRTANFYRGYVMSRRLNRAEYANTIRDLFGADLGLPLEELLPADGGGGEGFDTTGNALFTSSIHIEKYLDAAERIIAIVVPDRARGLSKELKAARERVLVEKPGWLGKPGPAARAVLTQFSRRAWRRPVAGEEMDRLMTLFERGIERGDGYAASLRLALQAVLVSPHFLFLAEPEVEEGGVHRLRDVPLASKLSYFIWSSMPDNELLALAETGRLAHTNVYRAQVRRMLADPKASALGERFALQWLELERLGADVRPDATRFPEFDDALSRSMKQEVVVYFNHLISEDRSLLELIDSDYTFVNDRLARLYGLPEVQGAAMTRVRMTEAGRGGLIGMAAVHAMTSYPLRTSPVLRGHWVLAALLGDKVPPPPPDVPALDEQGMDLAGLSLREQLEKHRTNPDCASCHDRMDPLGFGLENFDVLGRWRIEDRGQPLDTTGRLPSGETYTGPDGLKKVLMDRKEKILRHLARKMTGFAFGRDLNRLDECVIDRAMDALEQNEYRATMLMEAIATSFQFQHRFYPKESPPDT
jgi:PAS domain-containing protein